MSKEVPGSGTEQWQERIIGDRLAVDQEFAQHIQASGLSNQSWELVMTAAEFEIKQPGEPEQARLVLNLDRLDGVLPAIADIEQSQAGGLQTDRGLLDRIAGLFSSGGRGETYRQEAESLADAYTSALQARLEDTGRWDHLLELAASES